MPALGPPEALSPRDWNAIVDYDQWNDPYTPDEGVVFHHGGGADYPAGRTSSVADEIQQLQQWEGYHLYSKGWRGLAYGWGVGQSGTIYRIRGWNSYGAHRGDHDGDGVSNNEELIPIIWIASGNHHTVSHAAQDAVSRLRRWMLDSAPRAVRLYGHQEVSTTTCPGPNGMAYVTANRELPQEDFMFIAAKGTKAHEKFGWPDKGPPVEYWQHFLRKLDPDYDPGVGGWGDANSREFKAELAKFSPGDPVIGPGEKLALEVRLAQKVAPTPTTSAHDHDGRYVKNVTVSK